jgi:hypothetical protein
MSQISAEIINGMLMASIVLAIIFIPTCCCQLSHQDYHQIVEGIEQHK